MQLSQMVTISKFLNKYQSTFNNYSNISIERLKVLVDELESVVNKIKQLEEEHVKNPVLMDLPDSNFKLNEVASMLQKRTFQEIQYRTLQLSIFSDVTNELNS